MLDDAPNAKPPRREDCISLKEAAGIGHLPGFYLGMANQANQSKDLMLDRKVGAAVCSEQVQAKRDSREEKLAPLVKFSIYDLKRIDVKRDNIAVKSQEEQIQLAR